MASATTDRKREGLDVFFLENLSFFCQDKYINKYIPIYKYTMYFLMDFIKSNFVCLRVEMYTHVWCCGGKGKRGIEEGTNDKG